MRDGGCRGKFARKNILFYTGMSALNISLIFMLTESKNKGIQPKIARRGLVLRDFFSLITKPIGRIIMGKILSWNWIPQNIEIKKHEN